MATPDPISPAALYPADAILPAHIAALALIIFAIWLAHSRVAGADTGDRGPANWRAVGVASLSMALMAGSIVAVKPILPKVHAITALSIRLVGAMPRLLARVALHAGRRANLREVFTPGRHWGVLLPATFVGTYLSLLFWMLGFKYGESGPVALLNQLATIFTVILAAIFLREPVGPRKAIAAVTATVGASILVMT